MEHGAHGVGRGFFHDLFKFGFMFVYGFISFGSVTAFNCSDGCEIGFITAAGEAGISGCHVQRGYTVGETTQGQSRVIVIVHEGKPQLFGKFPTGGRTDFLEHSNGAGIDGILDGHAHGNLTSVTAAGIFRFIGTGQRRVENGVVGRIAFIQRGTVRSDGLDGRTGLSFHIRGAVVAEAGIVFSAAGHAVDLTGLRVHKDGGAFQLVVTVAFGEGVVPVQVDIIQFILNGGVHCGMDAETAGVDGAGAVTKFHQNVVGFLDGVVDEVRITFGAFLGRTHIQYDIFGFGRVGFFFGNRTALDHVVQNLIPYFYGLIHIGGGRIGVGRGEHSHEGCRFTHCQLSHIFAEVVLSRGADPIDIAAHKDFV